jgi:prolipoprotein diacylglyceryltransferase
MMKSRQPCVSVAAYGFMVVIQFCLMLWMVRRGNSEGTNINNNGISNLDFDHVLENRDVNSL